MIRDSATVTMESGRAYRKPPSFFRMVPSLTSMTFPFPQNGRFLYIRAISPFATLLWSLLCIGDVHYVIVTSVFTLPCTPACRCVHVMCDVMASWLFAVQQYHGSNGIPSEYSEFRTRYYVFYKVFIVWLKRLKTAVYNNLIIIIIICLCTNSSMMLMF